MMNLKTFLRSEHWEDWEANNPPPKILTPFGVHRRWRKCIEQTFKDGKLSKNDKGFLLSEIIDLWFFHVKKGTLHKRVKQ